VLPSDCDAIAPRETFDSIFNPKKNAFGILRLLLAVLVMVGHSFPLGGFGPETPVPGLTGGQHSLGTLAVALFFLLSGFLITRSAESGITVGRFLWHRFLRIFPGYWGCLFFSAFILAPVVCALEYGSPLYVFLAPTKTAQSYFFQNLLMFHPRGIGSTGVMPVSSAYIFGLFANNPTPQAMNGSLWTLPIELLCYLWVASLAVFGIVRRHRAVVLIFFVAFYGLYEFDCYWPELSRSYFPWLGARLFSTFCLFFAAGCVAFLYRDKIPYSAALYISATGLALLGMGVKTFTFLTPIALSYAFLCLSFKLPLKGMSQDISYGMYIYAFPIQQTMAFAGVHQAGFVVYLLTSLLVTAVFAILSYRLIEEPCLRWKDFDPVQRARGSRFTGLFTTKRTLLVFPATSEGPETNRAIP
jgi:peptidoglycan/LPS O-acetylase OafA/YrhL